jgi:hypothetical protein
MQAKDFFAFRKSIKKPFKSRESLNAWLSLLEKLSGGSSETATQIIERSIANGWQGIFEIKNKASPPISPQNKGGKANNGYNFDEKSFDG